MATKKQPGDKSSSSKRRSSKATVGCKISAATWAASYYSGQDVYHATPSDTARTLTISSGRDDAIKEGIPTLPDLNLDADGAWLNSGEYLDACYNAMLEGYGLATLRALWACIVFAPRDPLPNWLRGRVVEAICGWEDRTWLTLEQSFGAKLPRGKQAETHFRYTLGGQILIDVATASAAGVPRDRELYHAVGAHYSTSAATVERIVSKTKPRTKKAK